MKAKITEGRYWNILVGKMDKNRYRATAVSYEQADGTTDVEALSALAERLGITVDQIEED